VPRARWLRPSDVDPLARQRLDRNPGLQELTDRVFFGDNDRVEAALADADQRIAETLSRLEDRAMPIGRMVVMPSGVRYPPMPK
jgi:hypothetical protein